MFHLKNKKLAQSEKATADPNDAPKKKRTFFWNVARYSLKTLKYFSLLLLILLMGAAGALFWTFQTEGGQHWLANTVNKMIAPAEGQPGYRITRLAGSLPCDFQFGIEAYDTNGLWLSAPLNRFTLNWRELPKVAHISALQVQDADISRLPKFPPDPAPQPPSPPPSLGDIQGMLADAADFLAKKHWWLPEIRIDGVKVENLLLPADMLAQSQPGARLRLDSTLEAGFLDNTATLALKANMLNADAAQVSIPGFSFQSAASELVFTAAPNKQEAGINARGSLMASLNTPKLESPDIPDDFLGDSSRLSLELTADAVTAASNPSMSISLSGPDLTAGSAQMKGAAAWKSGAAWKNGGIDGPIDCSLNFTLSPLEQPPAASPLAMLHAPLGLNLKLAGNLPRIDANLSLDCQKLAKDGHALENLLLSLSGRDIDLPLNATELAALENEHSLDLKLGAVLDKDNIGLASRIFFQAITKRNSEHGGWKAGLRELTFDALGILAKGNLSAVLPEGQNPRMDGALSLSLSNWDSIDKFTPGKKFSGNVKADVLLDTKALEDANISQNASLNISIANFAMQENSGEPVVAIRNLDARARLSDLFGQRIIDANLESARIAAANMDFRPVVKVKGPLAGPLQAEITCSGSVEAKLAAQWQPGSAVLKTLDARMRMPGKNSVMLGARLAGPSQIEYGEKGIAIQNLDVAITPSGHLRANGALAPKKLDFNLDLQNLQFKPWQALLPQIPTGSASLRASLKGTPQRPTGTLELALRDVNVPGISIAPISLVLEGGIRNAGAASALGARLKLDPKTVRALGGTTADISARLPLLFGPDGIPRPDMNGNLAAHIRWDGALGPIWNLLPIPDQRLNGRVDININAAGPLSKPRITGGAQIGNGRYENLLLGILITDINLKLGLSEQGNINKLKAGALEAIPGGMSLAFSASDGRGGTIKINGKGALDGSGLDIHGKIDRLRPLRRRDVHIELSGNANVTGSATAPDINGEIVINQGEVLLNNIAFGGSVTTLPISSGSKQEGRAPREEPPAAGATASSANSGRLNVRVNMLPRFTVEGRGLNSVWKANLLIGGTPINPQVTGNISVVRGNFDFLGKNFALTRGVVFFGGGSLSNPLLDIDMTNETPDLTAHILLTGPVDKMKLTLTSDPSLPRDDILSRVLFGKSINDLSRLEALQLAAAVAQLAGFGGGAGILDFAKKTLGVDVLRLGTSSADAAGEPGDQTAGGTTIEMGKYINDMIYMGVQQGLKPDSTAFIIQLELTPRTSLEVRTEQNNTWGGLKWKYDY